MKRLPVQAAAMARTFLLRVVALAGEVFSGVDINLALVEDGQAFAYRQHLSGFDAKAYLAAGSTCSVPPGVAGAHCLRAGSPAGLASAKCQP
jgi:hypothetical protein